jgi:hypothetical protein
MTATAPITMAEATNGYPVTPIRPAMPLANPNIEKVRIPATRVPGFFFPELPAALDADKQPAGERCHDRQ